MSFNGLTVYSDLLPSSSYSTLLYQKFLLIDPDSYENGEIYIFRNGERSYCLIYDLHPDPDVDNAFRFQFIQYSAQNSGYNYVYNFETGIRTMTLSQWQPSSYVFQSSGGEALFGNVILAEGYVDFVRQQNIENLLTVGSICVACLLLFTLFVQFFRKIIF